MVARQEVVVNRHRDGGNPASYDRRFFRIKNLEEKEVISLTYERIGAYSYAPWKPTVFQHSLHLPLLTGAVHLFEFLFRALIKTLKKVLHLGP